MRAIVNDRYSLGPNGGPTGRLQPGRVSFADVNIRTAVFDLFRAFGITRIFGNPGSTKLGLFFDFSKDFR